MARKQRRRKKQTNTEQYNTLRLVGEYLGYQLRELKRVSRKALKEAEKIYKATRKRLREEGITDLPNRNKIAQRILEQEKQQQEQPAIPQPEEREPLPYADENETMDYTGEFEIIEEFKRSCLDAIDEIQVYYGATNYSMFSDSMVKACMQMYEWAMELQANDAEEFATWLAQSIEWERFRAMLFSDSDKTAEIIGDLYDAVEGIVTHYKSTRIEQSPTFIAPTTITFE